VDTGTAIAGYAAVVATGSLLWQVINARRADVEVQLHNYWCAGEMEDDSGQWCGRIAIINRTGQTLNVVKTGVRLAPRYRRRAASYRLDVMLGQVAALDAVTATFPAHYLEAIQGLEDHQGTRVQAWAEVSTGERFFSRPATLRPSQLIPIRDKTFFSISLDGIRAMLAAIKAGSSAEEVAEAYNSKLPGRTTDG